jgi:hypothetical protein
MTLPIFKNFTDFGSLRSNIANRHNPDSTLHKDVYVMSRSDKEVARRYLADHLNLMDFAQDLFPSLQNKGYLRYKLPCDVEDWIHLAKAHPSDVGQTGVSTLLDLGVYDARYIVLCMSYHLEDVFRNLEPHSKNGQECLDWVKSLFDAELVCSPESLKQVVLKGQQEGFGNLEHEPKDIQKALHFFMMAQATGNYTELLTAHDNSFLDKSPEDYLRSLTANPEGFNVLNMSLEWILKTLTYLVDFGIIPMKVSKEEWESFRVDLKQYVINHWI